MTVPEKVLVGQEEDDWESDAEDDEATVMVSAILKQDRETAMFLSGEIILDDQMSQCIFQYENLLHGILERDYVRNRRGPIRTASGKDRKSNWIPKDRRYCWPGGKIS